MTEQQKQKWVGVVPPGTWRPPPDGGYRGYTDPECESPPPPPRGRAGTSPPDRRKAS